MAELPPVLSTAQVAKLLGKSVRTIQRAAESGEIPAIKLDGLTGSYVFDRQVIEFVVKQQTRDMATDAAS